MIHAVFVPTRNKTCTDLQRMIIVSLNTSGNVVTLTIVAVGEPPSKYLLKISVIRVSSNPCGSFTYFKL